jgi:TM2 domain-containing membrane protein YozV
MALDTAQLQLIEQRVANDGPSAAVSYVLWFLLGLLGVHRFYLGRVGSGVVMLVLSITVFGVFITGIWWIVDAFLIPGMMNEKRQALRQKLMTEMMALGTGAAMATAPVMAPQGPAQLPPSDPPTAIAPST